VSGEQPFNPNERSGRLFDQDALDQNEPNLSKVGASSADIKDNLDFMPSDLTELAEKRVRTSLEELEKIWAMEDLQAQAKDVLLRAQARYETSRRTKLALKMVDASGQVEGIGLLVGMAARVSHNDTLEQAGVFAMSSAWVVREGARRLLL
jgi:hypothetical protein